MKKSFEFKIVERWAEKNGIAERYAEWSEKRSMQSSRHADPHPAAWLPEEDPEIVIPHTRQR